MSGAIHTRSKAAKRRTRKEDGHSGDAAAGDGDALANHMHAAATPVTTNGTGTGGSVVAVSAAAASDPRVALKEMGNRAFIDKRMHEAIQYFTQAIEAPVSVDTDAITAAAAASTAAASSTAATSVPLPPPFIASVYSNRSAAYAACFEWENALNDADKVISLASRWSKGFYRRGLALEGLMKLNEALQAYRSGLEIDPQDQNLKRCVENVDGMVEELNNGSKAGMEGEAGENPENDKFDRLIDWLLRGKCRFPSLYLKYYSPEYRGVHALTRINKDEVVLEVPLSHIMTSEVARASDIGQKITASGVDLNSTHTFLACYLLQERDNPTSFWKPYIDILPKAFSNLPIFFNQDELSYLKGSFSLGKIADRHAELKEEYDNICNAVPEFSKWKLDDFIWARSVVITRIFGLVINNGKTDGLVPMADMLNHKRPRETSWTYEDAKGAFTITALRSMNRGEQIFDSYGRKCNSRFFVNYGFSLENNEADNQAVMWFTLPPADPHYQTKVRLLGGPNRSGVASGSPKRCQVPIDYNEDVTKECFSFLRFVHAKDSELMILSAVEKFDVKKIEPLSLRNELEVIADLSIAASNSLSQFDCDEEQDTRLLADPKLTTNIRNAILMRRGEKQVLAYYRDLDGVIRQLVELPWPQYKKAVAKCQALKGKYDHYITTVIDPLMRARH